MQRPATPHTQTDNAGEQAQLCYLGRTEKSIHGDPLSIIHSQQEATGHADRSRQADGGDTAFAANASTGLVATVTRGRTTFQSLGLGNRPAADWGALSRTAHFT